MFGDESLFMGLVCRAFSLRLKVQDVKFGGLGFGRRQMKQRPKVERFGIM